MRRGTAAVVAGLALAGCGGASRGSPSKSSTTHAAPTGFSVGVGEASARISATLISPNHGAVAGRPWPYSVRVTDRRGRPMEGTVRIQFTRLGHLIGTDTPPVHPLRGGRWNGTIEFPSAAEGLPLTFQVLVRTRAGSVTLNWPVTVRPK